MNEKQAPENPLPGLTQITVSTKLADWLEKLLDAPGCPYKDVNGVLTHICQGWAMLIETMTNEAKKQIIEKPNIGVITVLKKPT